MSDGRPNTDPPTEAHDSNQLGGEQPTYFAAAAALDALDTDLSNHAGATGDVHGVPAGDSVAGQSDVDAVTTDLSNHSGSSSGVHGVGGSAVESVSGAQSKADSAESSANTYTDDHEAKNNPHSSSASSTDLSNHANDGTNPHGVSTSQIGALAASDYNPESDTHSPPTNTQDTSRSGVLTGEFFTGSIIDIPSGGTETTTVNVGRQTDEVVITISAAGEIQLKSYQIKDGSGTVTKSSTSESASGNYTKTILFNGVYVSNVSFTHENTGGSTNGLYEQKVQTRIIAVGNHNHQI